ncbi:amino acid racemase [archaeon]|nr:amino acid racemase [archaeon]MBL7057145.1 amino acid racemase [Candidatus Woesearchaeota archaeon]
MKLYKKIGILGGMGPEATAELYREIIRIFQKKYGAVYDNDFPEMVILNLPLPDVVENLESDYEIKRVLDYGIKKLISAEVDFIAVPCNTATAFIIDDVFFVNIIAETIKIIKDQKLKKVGILATRTTIGSGLYQKLLKDIKLLIPDSNDQEKITKIIMNILSGEKSSEDKNLLCSMISNMKINGAEKVILGCTELPLLYKGEDTIDTLAILANAVVKRAITKII